MTTTLDLASQLLMDLYYQGYPNEGAWLTLPHAKMLFSSEYNRLVRADFLRMRVLAKAETGWSVAEIDPSWLVAENVTISSNGSLGAAELSQKIFYFDYDSMASGVQSLEGECDFVRITLQDRWAAIRAPKTKAVMWYVNPSMVKDGDIASIKTKLKFIGDNIPKSADVYYVPSVDENNGDAPINESKSKTVIDAVLQTLFISKQQVVIDKSNDGNSNAVLATEINPDNKN